MPRKPPTRPSHGASAQPGTAGIYPQMFTGGQPGPGAADYLRDPAVRTLLEFFERKGQAVLSDEDRREQWYADWLAYQAQHRLYAQLLTPAEFSATGGQFNLLRYARFLEVFASCSPSHGYSLQVSFLGLFSILMGTQEPLKREAVAALEAGHLLAFGVSEQHHGADLLANEFTLTPSGDGLYRANGAKYYIGNAGAAALIATLARMEPGPHGRAARIPFILVALRPVEKNGTWQERKIPTLGVRAADVGAFEVHDWRVSESDIIAQGRAAWDAVFGTVTLGKFFLGFGSIGICEHAFHEAAAHLQHRILYGKPALEMPHLQSLMAQAYARLLAMKLYAYRALDYLHAASADDRRYQLFCAVQKARVSSEGVKVMALLSEAIGAKGFEGGTFCEIALRDSLLIPGLEGSMHINLDLAAQFLPQFFARAAVPPNAPPSLLASATAAPENAYLLHARTGGTRSIAFDWFLNAFHQYLDIPNVRLFAAQAARFRRYVMQCKNPQPGATPGHLIPQGQCLATIVYAQLIADNARLLDIPPRLLAAIFSLLILDLNTAVMHLLATAPLDPAQRVALSRVCVMPEARAEDWESLHSLVSRIATA